MTNETQVQSRSLEEAIQLYEESEKFDWAIHLAKQSGMDWKVRELLKKQSFLMEEEGYFSIAAGNAEQLGETDRAKKLWEKSSYQAEAEGDFANAGYSAARAGLYERASHFCEKAGPIHLWGTADFAEKAGQIERAKLFYNQLLQMREEEIEKGNRSSNSYKTAAKLADKLGLPEKSKNYFEKAEAEKVWEGSPQIRGVYSHFD